MELNKKELAKKKDTTKEKCITQTNQQTKMHQYPWQNKPEFTDRRQIRCTIEIVVSNSYVFLQIVVVFTSRYCVNSWFKDLVTIRT